MTETKVPALPAPTSDNLLQVARALKSMLDVREGRTGDALDANVTFRDLIDSGLANKRQGFSGFGSGVMPVLPPWVENDGYDPTQDFLSPSKPTGVTATGLFASVQLQWDQPTYRNHAYAEVWRADTDVIGNAVLIGTSESRFYVDNLGTGATRFYWVRFVSQADIIGPYNATAGIQASTSQDPTYLMDVLSDAFGSTSLAPFFQLDAPTTINGVSIPAGTYIKQAFIADATISRAKIQLLAVDNARIASIDAAKITTGFLDAARINAGTITSDKIDTRNLTIKDSLGNTIVSASGISSANVSGLGALASADQINTGNISTYIAAGAITNAYIGNFISSTNFDGSINAGGSITSNGTVGWAIGKAGTAVFNDANIRGSINGGSYTGYAWPSSGSGFHLGPNGLLMGNFNTGRYFQVDSLGNMYAPQFNVVNGNATFSGALSAASGSFSGTLTAQVVNTANIVGAAVTASYVATSSSSAVSATAVVPSGAAAVFITVGLGNYSYDDGKGGTFTGPNSGTLSVSGSAVASGTAVIVYGISNPTPGSLTVSVTRGPYYAPGGFTLSQPVVLMIQVAKR